MVRALIIFLLLLLPVSVLADDVTIWPSERRDSTNSAVLALSTAEFSGTLLEWHFARNTDLRYKPGVAVWASPALAFVDGRPMAFVGGYDQTMHALDLASKEERWSKITNAEIPCGPIVGLIQDRQVVFWTSNDRYLYAQFALEGTRLWSRELVAPTSTLGDVSMTSPVLHNGKLFVCAFAYDRAIARNDQKADLIALEAATGRELWRIRIASGPVNSPSVAVVNGRATAFVSARKGIIQAFDISAGHPEKPIWTYQMPHEVLGSPAIAKIGTQHLLYIGSKFGNLVALNAETGKEVWKRMAGNWFDNSVSVAKRNGEDVVYAGSHDYCLYCFRASDGEQIWRKPLGGEIFSVPVSFRMKDAEYILVSALDNHTYLIDARSSDIISTYFTGEPLWDKIAKGDNVWGSAAVISSLNSTVAVFGSFNGYVYTIPLDAESSLTAKFRSATGLWISLAAFFVVFAFIILPIILMLPPRKQRV